MKNNFLFMIIKFPPTKNKYFKYWYTLSTYSFLSYRWKATKPLLNLKTLNYEKSFINHCIHSSLFRSVTRSLSFRKKHCESWKPGKGHSSILFLWFPHQWETLSLCAVARKHGPVTGKNTRSDESSDWISRYRRSAAEIRHGKLYGREKNQTLRNEW